MTRPLRARTASVDIPSVIEDPNTDPLTGLPHRRRFLELAADSIVDSEATMLLVDIINFRAVNDGLGHAVGDDLLYAVAARISAAVRDSDQVARIGGDEFAVLLTGPTSETDASALAERILQSLQEPFQLGPVRLIVRLSIGAATAPTGADLAVLFRNADLALYESKRLGANRLAVFEEQLYENAATRIQLETELDQALENGQIRLMYQPIVSSESRQIVGAEALVRWQHPRLGSIPPSTFIPLAESTQQVVEIGRWAIRRACAEAAGWPTGETAPYVGVNVSALQLADPTFVDHTLQALAEAPLRGERLVLELTETVIAAEFSGVEDALRSVRDHGVRVAIDDFGTGYSSLSYLERIPVDVLKVDQTFVAGLDANNASKSLAGAVLAIATTLGLSTIAEGVETADQAESLRRLGCTALQGHLYSPALESGDFVKLLADREA